MKLGLQWSTIPNFQASLGVDPGNLTPRVACESDLELSSGNSRDAFVEGILVGRVLIGSIILLDGRERSFAKGDITSSILETTFAVMRLSQSIANQQAQMLNKLVKKELRIK